MEPSENEVTKPHLREGDVPWWDRLRQSGARLISALNPRERVGDFFNAFEERRALRVKCLAGLVIAGALVIVGFWFGPRWREDRVIAVARQWLAANKLDRAGEAVSEAIARAPHRVEAWQVAAEHARRAGWPQRSVAFRRHAASLQPADTALQLDWAAEAVAVKNLEEAENALAKIPAEIRARSAPAERLTGEIARQQGDLAKARRQFEAAVRLGGAVAENEIPLGITLLGSAASEDRRAGDALLLRWRDDPVWGVEALRALLADALRQEELSRLPELAAALMAHPAREQADTLNGLLALGKSDAARFAAALQATQRAWAVAPAQVSGLVAWLSGTGRGAEAARWVGTLPREVAAVPPVAVALADALRVLSDWPALRAEARVGEWSEVEFLRHAYLMLAERALGETARADELWSGLRETSRLNGGRALFLAGTLYSWGRHAEAIELWWLIAEEPGVGVAALGSLARHYQVQRDADGLYRAFRRLHELKSADRRIANNYAFFAALTDRSVAAAERITLANHEAFPEEAVYAATRAFVLYRAGRAEAAHALLPRFATAAKDSPALAFTSGLVLAGSGRAEEAREHLARVDERSLTLREAELLNRARAATAKP